MEHLKKSDALILVIDASDKEKFPDLKEILHSFMKNASLKNLIYFILANKCDIPTAVSATELLETFELFNFGDRKWSFHDCSALHGEGIIEGLSWLDTKLKTRKKR